MKTHRVNGPCDPAILHAALVEQGLPVVTVRADSARAGEPAMYAVVVVEDHAQTQDVMSVLLAHVAQGAPSRTPTASEKAAGLKTLEFMG